MKRMGRDLIYYSGICLEAVVYCEGGFGGFKPYLLPEIP
jgi:hypothetical protein